MSNLHCYLNIQLDYSSTRVSNDYDTCSHSYRFRECFQQLIDRKTTRERIVDFSVNLKTKSKFDRQYVSTGLSLCIKFVSLMLTSADCMATPNPVKSPFGPLKTVRLSKLPCIDHVDIAMWLVVEFTCKFHQFSWYVVSSLQSSTHMHGRELHNMLPEPDSTH